MRTLKMLSVVFVAVSLLSSCVSSRKYKESVSEKNRWEQKYSTLQTDYAKLESDKQQLESEKRKLEASNSNEKMSLSEKEKALSEEQKKLQELKALVDDERNAIRNLKQEVCSALKCFTPDELQVEVRNGKLYVSMSDKLLFPSGSDVVNERGKEAISMLASVLSHSDLEIMVEGHTDPVPIHTAVNRDNWDLSVRRATSVTRIFVDNGIPPERVIASGRSKFHPIADNETAEGRQQNRRTEIVLAPKLDKLWKLTEQEDIKTTEK